MSVLNYKEKLFDKKWKEKRLKIMLRDHNRCVICGATEKLVVHHKQYHITPDGKKYLPWMYDDKFLITLCENCHRKGHNSYKVPVKVVPLPKKSIFDF